MTDKSGNASEEDVITARAMRDEAIVLRDQFDRFIARLDLLLARNTHIGDNGFVESNELKLIGD